MTDLSAYSVVKSYDKSAKASAGNRLSVLTYKGRDQEVAADCTAPNKFSKTDKKGTVKHYVPVPKFASLVVEVPELRIAFAPGVPATIVSLSIALWEDQQDKLIKSLVDGKRGKDGLSPASSKLSIMHDEIDLAACATFASSTGNGKLTKEGIAAWFDDVLSLSLTKALLVKDPSRTDADIGVFLDSYKPAFLSLAAVQPGQPAATYEQLRKALATTEEDDQMAERLMARINTVDKPVASLLAGL